MTKKSATTKPKASAAKPAAVRKAAAVKAAVSRPAPAKAAVAAKAGKKNKKPKKAESKAGDKTKVIRDSFTMPQSDYAKIAELKQICLKADVHVKKSELLRAGLHALSKLSAAQLKQAIAQVEQIKTGRPKKG
jgi:transcription antitermination factor NusG